jgi:regulator of protease activity HflC (stomatin/prohibitin superfamily)
MLTLGLISGLGLVALVVFYLAAFRVENGSVAVLTVFGRFMRDRNGTVQTFSPGMHGKAPWAKAITVSLAERSISLKPGNEPIEVLASDGTRIKVNARLRFRVESISVSTFLADAKDPLDHLYGLFRANLREQFARFGLVGNELSSYTALRLRMHELQQKTLGAITDEALREYGIRVVAVDLLQIDPPDELVDSLNAVVTAESEANALVSRTELQSTQRTLSAEQAVAIASARAAAQEQEIRTVGVELSTLHQHGVLREYVERRRAEVMGGSRRLYLNHTSTSSSTQPAAKVARSES